MTDSVSRNNRKVVVAFRWSAFTASVTWLERRRRSHRFVALVESLTNFCDREHARRALLAAPGRRGREAAVKRWLATTAKRKAGQRC